MNSPKIKSGALLDYSFNKIVSTNKIFLSKKNLAMLYFKPDSMLNLTVMIMINIMDDIMRIQ